MLEAGPGTIFDPAARMPYSKQHIIVRATTGCRLAVVPRTYLDNQALLGVATEQRSRLDSARKRSSASSAGGICASPERDIS